MSKEYTDLEMELMHENDVLRQNEQDLLGVVNSAQITLKELIRPHPDIEVYDWAEFITKGISNVKRQCSFRKTILRRRYPNTI